MLMKQKKSLTLYVWTLSSFDMNYTMNRIQEIEIIVVTIIILISVNTSQSFVLFQ